MPIHIQGLLPPDIMYLYLLDSPRPRDETSFGLTVANGVTRCLCSLLSYLSDFGLELLDKILRCPGDNSIANQEHRRALHIELLG